MKTKEGTIMDEKDIAFTEAIHSIGIFGKNEAKILSYLLQKQNGHSREFEKTTGLRQPEVSNAIKKLRKINIITIHDVERKQGKGRSIIHYTITDNDILISKINKTAQDQIEKIHNNLTQIITYIQSSQNK